MTRVDVGLIAPHRPRFFLLVKTRGRYAGAHGAPLKADAGEIIGRKAFSLNFSDEKVKSGGG